MSLFVEMENMCSGQHTETVQERFTRQALRERWEAAESLFVTQHTRSELATAFQAPF